MKNIYSELQKYSEIVFGMTVKKPHLQADELFRKMLAIGVGTFLARLASLMAFLGAIGESYGEN